MELECGSPWHLAVFTFSFCVFWVKSRIRVEICVFCAFCVFWVKIVNPG